MEVSDNVFAFNYHVNLTMTHTQARIIFRVLQPNGYFLYPYPNIPIPASLVISLEFLSYSLPFTNKDTFAALDYRLAPETNFPGPLHDAATGYFRLTEDLRIPPENIVLAGDSAGGGLCLALMLYLRDNNYPLPSGAILMSPWVGTYFPELIP